MSQKEPKNFHNAEFDEHWLQAMQASKQDSQIVRILGVIRDKLVVEEGSNQVELDRLCQWANGGRFNVKSCYDFF